MIFAERKVLFFMSGWLVVNLLQASLTGLANDEAYYWVYARYLDIGYYDHPPMIAWLIWPGYWLLEGETGLRLLVIILGALTFPLLFLLAGKRDFNLLALLYCSITVFQLYGFIAVPDAPLLFFTVFFFYAYKNYLRENSRKATLLLILAIVLMLYSKYHGFLVLFFTLLSNPSLFRRKSFYAVTGGVLLLYAPHIWWQINHDYPSYQYHVLNKSQTDFNFADLLTLPGGLFLVAGPLITPFLVYALIQHRAVDPLFRALKFTCWGFCIFFFLSTFNAPIEANWLAAAVVPLILIGHEYISASAALKKGVTVFAWTSILIFAFSRVNLATNVVPSLGGKLLPEFYGWNGWADEVKKQSRGLPVVMMNSYQMASKYSFHSGKDALSLNNVAYRSNQYDIWSIADSLQGKTVALFMPYAENRDSLKTFDTPRGKMQMLVIENFRSYNKVRIKTAKDWYHFKHGEEVFIPLTFHLENNNPQHFYHNPQYPVSLVYTRYYYDRHDGEFMLLDLDDAVITPGQTYTARIQLPEKTGPYYLRFSIRTGWMPPGLNSHIIRMDVE
ncbi:MAG TPA: glycosyltransferase family 39 protein [Bacteroidia bacterium]|nr:glycosyltransferase family 39 protein [Bacteroidia bacterium]